MALSDMFGLLGGGSSDPLDIYGDLFTKEQKAALQQRQMGEGLLRMAGAFGAAAQPSRMPTSFMGALGQAAGAMAGHGDEAANTALKSMQTAEAVRASKQKREWTAKILPMLMQAAQMEKQYNLPPGTLTSQLPSPTTAPPPGSGYTGPTNAELGAPPLPPGSGYSGPTNAELGAPPVAPGGTRPGSLPPRIGTRGEGPNAVTINTDTGQPIQSAPGGPTRALPPGGLPPLDSPPTEAERLEWNQVVGRGGLDIPLEVWVARRRAGQKQTGLLPPQDQLVGQDGQPLQGPGVLPTMNASFAGGMPGGTLPFRLASSIPTGSAPRGADILDTVVAPLESGNRNIHQRVTSPSVSSAQGYYQITNSTWKDTAPKAGVDLDKFPTAMSAPRNVQKQVAQKLYDERGLQPWADFNPAIAAATGYRRGGRFAGTGPDAGRIPAGGDDPMQAISALLQLTGGDKGEDDPLSGQTGGPDTLIPSPGGPAGLPLRQANAALAPLAIDNAVLGGKSSVAGIGDALSNAILKMRTAMPPKLQERLRIISGERTPKRQIDVYRGSGTPPPMNSRHIYGDAVDLQRDPDVLNWIKTNGPGNFGVGFPLEATMGAKEANHLEMVDASGNRLPPQDTVIPSGRGIPASALRNVADTGAAPGGGGGIIPGLNMTPQQAGAMGAITEILGLDNPFKPILDTYYKSPGYLGEAATATSTAQKEVDLKYGPQIKKAETLAELQAQIELKPKLEAAVAWAKVDPSLSEYQRKAVIDRESKRIEQIQTAMTSSREVVVTPPNGGPRKLTLTNEQILRLNQGKPLPEIGLPAMSAIQLGEEVLTKQQEVDITSRGAAQTEMYKAGQKALDTAHDAVRGANQRTPYYASMLTAMEGFKPGATAEARLTTMQYLKDMNIIKGENVSQGEALKLAGERLAFLAVPPNQGSWSNIERQSLKSSIGQMSLTPEGLTEAIRMMQQLDDYDRKVSEIHRQVADKNQGLPNLLEAQRRVEALGPPLTAQQEAALERLRQPASATTAAPPPPPGAAAAPGSTSLRGGGAEAPIPPPPTDRATYDRLPPGSQYIAPDGSTRTKR